MSYILEPDPGSPRSRTRWWVLGVAVLLIVVGGFVLGRTGVGRGDGAAGSGSDTAEQIRWSSVGTQPVPTSLLHGPQDSVGGLASGFTHDELGAVLAAVNISSRLSGDVGVEVYEATVRRQCVGDLDAMIAQIAGQSSTAAPGSTLPQRYWFRISGGDPGGDLVVVSLRARSLQASQLGGYAEITRTLQWLDGDWRVQVPIGAPRLVESVDGFTDLGGPNA